MVVIKVLYLLIILFFAIILVLLNQYYNTILYIIRSNILSIFLAANNYDGNQVEEGNNDVQEGDVLGGVADAAHSTRFVTAREYYCFKLQIRRGIFNILLFGGRLFQQWCVNMYIKIESMRLDW
jgi:hypothetical protein